MVPVLRHAEARSLWDSARKSPAGHGRAQWQGQPR
jgi:hypothetical protein